VLPENKDIGVYPVSHYSYSMWSMFCNNPLMFKVRYINHEYIERNEGVSALLGRALHRAMEVWHTADAEKAELIKLALDAGLAEINTYHDSVIDYNKTITDRNTLIEKYNFGFFTYIKETQIKDRNKIVLCEEKLEHRVEIETKNGKRELPIAIVGYPDLVYRNKGGQLVILDHKFISRYSGEKEIDGAKMIQAVFYYFLVYAETGERPHSIIFEEVKVIKNKDNTNQVRRYELVYEEVQEAFDLWYRLYEDITNALLGQQVFVPNFNAMFDGDIAMLTYIYGLDMDEQKEKSMKELRTKTLTELLSKRLEKSQSMKRYLDVVQKDFISANKLNYSKLPMNEQIQIKMAEHGIALQYLKKIEGLTVDMYCFDSSVGVRMGALARYEKDIELVLGISGVRILAPVPNEKYIGFEIPKQNRAFPELNVAVGGQDVAIGVRINGEPYVYDITSAPHLLIAGATGSGKSVLLHNIVRQLQTKENVEVHILDPKMVEFGEYEDMEKIQYLTDTKEMSEHLSKWQDIMQHRFTLLRKAKAKNITEYNAKGKNKMSYVYIIIDEFGDLVKGKIGSDVMDHALVLAQKARAVGIHLILATQRPSVDIISGTIKANFPARIALKTASIIDSRVILDIDGAEKLTGKGDILFADGTGAPVRLQGYTL